MMGLAMTGGNDRNSLRKCDKELLDCLNIWGSPVLCYSKGFAHPLPPNKIAQRSILLIAALLVVPDSIVGFEIKSHDNHSC